MAKNAKTNNSETAKYDYIVVGSGAGGGPLAARLAERGFRVLVLEAGGNQAAPPRGPAHEVTQVPVLHGAASEHPALSWQFFVDHYDTPPTGPDPKRVQDPNHRGFNKIFYPRAAALGGCTVHNAMITIAGPDSDWDDLADFLNDDSWRGSRMRAYFRRLEFNHYSLLPTKLPTTWWGKAWDNVKWLLGFDPDHARGEHGFEGWLHTSYTDLAPGFRDKQLLKMLKAALRQAKLTGLERAGTLASRFLTGRAWQSLDPNHARTQAESPEGLALIPLAVCGRRTTIHQSSDKPDVQRGRRSGPRERLLDVQQKHPDRLHIWTDCLVTKVLFDTSDPPRAIGVEYLQGQHLYRAHHEPSELEVAPQQVHVGEQGEVILCGGTFNTPQLLMLSGIGDKEQLKKFKLPLRVDSPGVGQNLQDRYEVTVISEMKQDFALLKDATSRLPASPDAPDPHLRQWRETGTGIYAGNGAVLSIFKRSRPDLAKPDLYIFGVVAPFKGYELGYSNVGDQHNMFTWTILKSHTNNHDGQVRLQSADPRDVPAINFHYFNETSLPNRGDEDPDLAAIVEGVKFVRGIAEHAKAVVKGEYHPKQTENVSDNDVQVRNWIRRVAWGHHACGTCRMGPDGDPQAVLDQRFRVRGVAGLRVVDASIFPTIPGYFIVTNIYMASEKAAEVIVADREAQAVSPHYPLELRRVEEEALVARRKLAGTATPNAIGVRTPQQEWSEDVTGLALSGGGIRSATLNLGILQALARSQWLRKIDFLSTVSGGGYIGAFLGRMFDRLRPVAANQPPSLNSSERVEHELTTYDSPALTWLRQHGNYIAPRGHSDWRLGIAAYIRNFLSVHFVLGMVFFALFGVANAIRYGLFDPATAGLGLVFMRSGDLPLGHLLRALLGPFFSPWFVAFELWLLFLVLPRAIGYWIVSQDKHERYHPVALPLLFLIAAAAIWLGLCQGLAPAPFAVGLALLSSLVPVELAWRYGRRREEALGTGGVETQRLRTRNILTYDLGLVLALAGLALAFALIDSAGHALQQRVEGNQAYLQAFAGLGVALAALMPLVRMLAGWFAGQDKPAGPPSTLRRIFRQQIIAGLLALVALAVPLVAFSFAAHAAYQGGDALVMGLAATAAAVVISVILRWSSAITFVNRSSLSQIYAARLARAYLGASNPLRHRPEGANITEVIAGDDVASIRDYQPHLAGGPFHLINAVVNQTVDFSSQRGSMDRKGESLAVSCAGLTVGQRWHALWADSTSRTLEQLNKRPTRLEPVGRVAGDSHPLVDEVGDPADAAEMLSLRQWIAISGAAVGPGQGQNTRLGTALLLGLANMRTGYWWNSSITEVSRDGFPQLNWLRRLLFLVPEFFLTQSLLLYEWLARFAGPWEQYWNLSDGGYFENTGAYELIRRRVPRIILCDGSADPTYDMESFGEFVRKVRIDFGAQVTPFTALDLKQHVPQAMSAWLGTPDQLRPDSPNRRHAVLYWVDYATHSRRSVILYFKASVSSDEPADILKYLARHREFPHEATGDQVFDEAQLESYRQLGEHMAGPLMPRSPALDHDWFWKIPV